ncbi:SCO family protein [Grimontia kaedaensis]|uniref:SCO family protein n=1 Tax=Grimontia kaedaensis TaxID=2872157 RepID=A0ABY4WS95_9GAMM|nr:SCO family protein [Grimontia kaedaensis]USH01444.1 SCO family protein [Grimontia kaedaensis]
MKRLKHFALILTLTLLAPLPLQGAPIDPVTKMPKAIDPLLFAKELAGIKFVDQTGEVVSTGDFRGKIVLLNFMYTTCKTVCPMQTQYMKTIRREIPAAARSDFVMLSVSLLPEQETPDVLSDYTRKMNIDAENWRFLTGTSQSIAKAAGMFGIQSQTSKANELEHTAKFFLFDGEGVIIQRYANQVAVIERVVNDVSSLHQISLDRIAARQ